MKLMFLRLQPSIVGRDLELGIMMNDEDEDYEYCMMTDVLYAMYFLFICM